MLLWFGDENTLISADVGYDTAYWTLGYQVGTWSMFVLGAAKFVLQVVSMVVGLLWFLGYNASYSLAVEEVAEDKSWTTEGGYAIAVASAIETDMVYASISQVAMH